MKVRIVDFELLQKPVQTRLPFKFGMHVLRTVPLSELKLTVETTNGETVIGHSSDLLVPKWFEKNPDKTPEEDSEALAESILMSAALGKATETGAAFDIWHSIYHQQVGERNHLDSDVLIRGFGVAMVERALIDAVCRHQQCSFHQALLKGLLGFDSERVLPETMGWIADRLSKPTQSIDIRHTVGMLDPLSVAEIPADDRVLDGLPQALEEDIDRYGLRWFKVKVCGDASTDSERLRDVARVVFEHARSNVKFTLDGNEQCSDLEAFSGMLEELKSDPQCRRLIENIVLIEQPLPRQETFSENKGLDRLKRIAPVIIDEADTDIDAFKRAVELGYSGTSIKACKGVFRAIANRALIDVRNDKSLFQSAEDLTNLGSIPLQQDLALQATLGMKHVERNGHHYFRGLDHLAADTCNVLTQSHPTLYIREGELTRLRIENGQLDIASVVNGFGFGGQLGNIEEDKKDQ